MDIRDLVRGYYGQHGLTKAVLDALASTGMDVSSLTPGDLVAVDQLHAGGAGASRYVLERLGVGPGVRLLDVGSGLGGPARMAAVLGADVTGIDLTPEFVDTATELSELVGLGERTRFIATDGAVLPFEEGSFDAAIMVHVGMNIELKEAVYREVARVLVPGGRFAVYDQLSSGAGNPTFPVPWADDERTSFLETEDAYRAHLEAAGFTVESVEEPLSSLPPPEPTAVGTPDVFGASFAERIGNHAAAARAGILRSVLLLSRRA